MRATLDDIRARGHLLSLAVTLGQQAVVDAEPFAEKMARLTATLEEQFATFVTLERAIRADLAVLGFDHSGSEPR